MARAREIREEQKGQLIQYQEMTEKDEKSKQGRRAKISSKR